MIATVDLGPYYFNATVVMAPPETPVQVEQGKGPPETAEEDNMGIVQEEHTDAPEQVAHGGAAVPTNRRAKKKKNKEIRCYGCGGGHEMRFCTRTSAAMQDRIWKLLERRDAGSKTQQKGLPQEETAAAAEAAPVHGKKCKPKPRLWRDTMAVDTEWTATHFQAIIVCGRCLERGHSVYDCNAPQEKVYNPQHWAIYEPALRKELEKHGKQWGIAGESWRDPEWRLPPKEAESSDTDCNWEDPQWRLPPVMVDSDGADSVTTTEYMPTLQRDEAEDGSTA
jgi:hypothetical protein